MTSNLTYSIFYNRVDWYKLILHLNDNFLLSRINYFFLKLSSVGGDHIEFTVNVKDNLKLELAEKCSNILKIFLKKNPSQPILIEPKVKSYYLDFPNNTLHYGVHNYFTPQFSLDEDVKKVHFKIAKIILSIFEEYREEILVSMTEIVLQIFVIFAQCSNKNIEQLIVYFNELYDEEKIKYDSSILQVEQKRVFNEFEQNKGILIPYLRDSILKKTNFPVKGWEKVTFDMFKESVRSKSVTPEQILKALHNNIGYSQLTSFIFFVEGLKILKDN
jgi:hypothetical protein